MHRGATLKDLSHVGPRSTFIKDLVPEFCGTGDNFENWKMQVETVRETYNVTSEMMKVIIIKCLKGRALTWFRSTPINIKMTFEEIVNNLEILFGSVCNKIGLRRQLESRRWKANETFLDYFYAKLELANKLSLEEPEIIEYIVDGINEPNIRSQAKMKKFSNLKELIDIMNNVGNQSDNRMKEKFEFKKKFERRIVEPNRVRNDKDLRCFNCGLKGHWASDCRHSKRQWGTCFKCGSLDHKSRDCNRKRGDDPQGQFGEIKRLDPEYKVWVKFPRLSTTVSVLALVDSGSPV